MRYHWTVEAWWQAEQLTGRWWTQRGAPDYEPQGLVDHMALRLNIFCERRRYAAERKHPRLI